MDFDIDVDISPLVGRVAQPAWVDSRWYEVAMGLNNPGSHRKKAHELLDNALHRAMWAARAQREAERRRAVRAPMLSRLHVSGHKHMVTADISLSGLRCVGLPAHGVFDVEFRVPGLQFPVDAKVEVARFRHSNVTPLTGLKFIDIDPGYLNPIANYIERKRSVALAA